MFNKNSLKMNNLFKALDDPTRRKILQMLNDGSLNAGQIAQAFEMTKPSISKHLDILKNADFVKAEKKGQFIYYTLNKNTIKKVVKWLDKLT
jgi:DNA-binding transcriptional ArsR family regulator